MKKVIIISGILVVLILCSIGLYLISIQTPSTTAPLDDAVKIDDIDPFTPTTDAFLIIPTQQGDVKVKNFLQAQSKDDEAEDSVTVDEAVTSIYFDPVYGNIDYDTSSKTFHISMSGKDKTETSFARDTLENALLELLGIDKTDACKLSIKETNIYRIGEYDESNNFENQPLSFCQ